MVCVALHFSLDNRLSLLFELGCTSCLCSSFLLLDLNTAELFEYILVVQDSVSKLISEFFTLKEFVDTAVNLRHAKNLVNCWPHGWVSLQKLLNDSACCTAEARWEWRVLTLDDPLSKLMERSSVKWRSQSSHLVEKNT